MPRKNLEKRREYQREYARGWYQRNKAKHIALVRSRDKRIKEWLKEYKRSLCCEVCGENHPACLKFHHINPLEKDFAIGRMLSKSSMRRIKEEIAKCRVLCANCHRKEHWNQRAQASAAFVKQTAEERLEI